MGIALLTRGPCTRQQLRALIRPDVGEVDDLLKTKETAP